MQVAGGAYFGAASLFAGNVTMNGSLNVGTVGTSDNRINFSGLTLDAGTNMTVIAERIYEASSEKSELLLFKGNDPANTAGPDRIRMRASEFRFQTYTTDEDYSGMSDNNNRLIISNSGDISISSTTASTSSSTGALQVAGGAYFGAASLFAGSLGVTGATTLSSNLTVNGTIIAGNAAVSAASWATSGIQLRSGSNTYTNSSTASSGTATSAVFNSFARPTLAASNTSVTTTNAATVYIDDSPIAGTNMTLSNSYSLWINSGRVLFGTGFDSTNRSLATLTINANTLRTDGEAAAHGLLISGGNTIANVCLYMGADNTNSVSYIQSSKVGSNIPLLLNNRGGGVGIGLNTVNYTLDVGGDINLTGSLRFSGTAITASATEINYLDITAAGTGQASKALVLDSSSNITGINNLTLNGTSSTLSLSGTSSVITISNTTASTSSSTGALRVAGGAYFGANSIFNNTLRVMGQSSPVAGEGLEFGYSSNTANIYSYDRSGSSYKNINLNDKMYIKGADGTVGIGTNSPAYSLDLGSTAQNMKINLFGGIYGIGACNSNLQSFSDTGFTWHTVNDAVTGNGTAPGTQIMTLSSSSLLTVGSISATSTTAFTVTNYAYYTSLPESGGSGGATNNYSLHTTGRIACGGELNVYSDYRLKNSIESLDEKYCKDFIQKTTPVKYNYNNDESQKHFGYIAQDVLKAGFDDLVTVCPYSDGIEEIIEDDGFLNPKDVIFVMSTTEIIPILSKNIQLIYNEKKILEDKIELLEQKNIDLETRLSKLEAFISTLEITE